MKARNIITNKIIDLSEYSEVIFETKTGRLRTYLKEGKLHISADDSLIIVPIGGNCVDILPKSDLYEGRKR